MRGNNGQLRIWYITNGLLENKGEVTNSQAASERDTRGCVSSKMNLHPEGKAKMQEQR